MVASAMDAGHVQTFIALATAIVSLITALAPYAFKKVSLIERLYAELVPQVRDGGPFELRVAIARLMAAAAKLPKA